MQVSNNLGEAVSEFQRFAQIVSEEKKAPVRAAKEAFKKEVLRMHQQEKVSPETISASICRVLTNEQYYPWIERHVKKWCSQGGEAGVSGNRDVVALGGAFVAACDANFPGEMYLIYAHKRRELKQQIRGRLDEGDSIVCVKRMLGTQEGSVVEQVAKVAKKRLFDLLIEKAEVFEGLKKEFDAYPVSEAVQTAKDNLRLTVLAKMISTDPSTINAECMQKLLKGYERVVVRLAQKAMEEYREKQTPGDEKGGLENLGLALQEACESTYRSGLIPELVRAEKQLESVCRSLSRMDVTDEVIKAKLLAAGCLISVNAFFGE